MARIAEEAELATLKRFHEVLPELPARDVASALRNVSTTKGINIQRARELRGEPTVIRHERATPAELWAELTAMFPSTVNGHAAEITDAEIVPRAGPGAGFALEAGPSASDESTPEG